MNYGDLDALYAAIGENHVSSQSLVSRVEKELQEINPGRPEQRPSTVVQLHRSRRDPTSVGVHVEGLDDVFVRLSRCCTPVPPDGIIGFVTRGRGVSVHRADCANASSLSADQPDRLIEVEWDEQADGHFVASVEVKGLDRPGLLRDVVDVLADNQVNVIGADTVTSGDDRVATMRFDFEIGDPSHLNRLLYLIRDVDSVYDVYRVGPGVKH